MNEANPAVFARPFSLDERGGDHPEPFYAQAGITLRDLAALETFKAMIGGYWTNPGDGSTDTIRFDRIAHRAFAAADAFLDERDRPNREMRANLRQERERIRNARYLVVPLWDSGDGGHWRFVYDKKVGHIAFAQCSADREQWREATEAEVVAMTHELLVHNQGAFIAPDECGAEAADTLPAWATPGAAS